MKLRFWGTRGSIPQPSYEALKFGGNTICTQLFYDDEDNSKYFIFDMGTGLINFGSEYRPITKEYHIFVCSFHWDYMQGLPFFYHIHRPNVKVYIYSSTNKKITSKNLNSLFDGTYSPLENINNLTADLYFERIPTEGFTIKGVKISFFEINKETYVSTIKIEYKNKIFVYAGNFEIDPKNKKIKEMIDFIKNADMFVCDAQYTDFEYKEKLGWGHSKIENTIDLAIKANVKNLLLFHHDPFNADNFLAGYLKNIIRDRDDIKNINIDFAKEGEKNIVSF